ncbi:MAG: hypothetical protein ACP5RZ_00615 [Thermoplasmata archaeon]
MLIRLYDIFDYGKMYIIKNPDAFPSERLLVESQLAGMNDYLIMGNYTPTDLRSSYNMIKKFKNNIKITVRRGFTFYQIIEILKELKNRYDLLIYYFDPISYSDLRNDEKFSLISGIVNGMLEYTSENNSITLFFSSYSFPFLARFPYILSEKHQNGYTIKYGDRIYRFYYIPGQLSIFDFDGE